MFISDHEKLMIAKTIGSATKNIVALTNITDGLANICASQQRRIENLEKEVSNLKREKKK
jgi:hypothetical protein